MFQANLSLQIPSEFLLMEQNVLFLVILIKNKCLKCRVKMKTTTQNRQALQNDESMIVNHEHSGRALRKLDKSYAWFLHATLFPLKCRGLMGICLPPPQTVRSPP